MKVQERFLLHFLAILCQEASKGITRRSPELSTIFRPEDEGKVFDPCVDYGEQQIGRLREEAIL